MSSHISYHCVRFWNELARASSLWFPIYTKQCFSTCSTLWLTNPYRRCTKDSFCAVHRYMKVLIHCFLFQSLWNNSESTLPPSSIIVQFFLLLNIILLSTSKIVYFPVLFANLCNYEVLDFPCFWPTYTVSPSCRTEMNVTGRLAYFTTTVSLRFLPSIFHQNRGSSVYVQQLSLSNFFVFALIGNFNSPGSYHSTY